MTMRFDENAKRALIVRRRNRQALISKRPERSLNPLDPRSKPMPSTRLYYTFFIPENLNLGFTAFRSDRLISSPCSNTLIGLDGSAILSHPTYIAA
jgi:hypothetical protein